MAYEISSTVMDYTKQTSTISYGINLSILEKLRSDNEAEELKKIIEKYSYGKVIRTTQSKVTNHAMPDRSWFQAIADLVNSKIGLNCVDQKAVLIFRHATTGRVIRLSIPAPKQDLFYYVEEKGLRVTQAKGEAIAADLKQVLGLGTIQFVRGYHTGKQ